MRYLTEVVCDNCGHREDTTEYHKECPVCVDGILKEVELECECGKAYSFDDMESAQDNYHHWKHLMTISPEELWESAWEDFAYSDGMGTWSYGDMSKPPDCNGLRYLYSSNRQWCYGTEAYTWEDYYQCECGKELEISNGW